MDEVGAGILKPVPGTEVETALPGTKPEGRLPRWQLSHAVDDGICEDEPAGLVRGITTMLGLPAKLAGTILGPWQVSHPEVMPVCVNWAPLNVFMPAEGTSPAGTLLTWQVSQVAVEGMCAGVSPARLTGVMP